MFTQSHFRQKSINSLNSEQYIVENPKVQKTRVDLFTRNCPMKLQRAFHGQDLVVLDVCTLHPLRRIRNGVISRSWCTDRSALRSHTRSPILLQNRLVESSTQAAINAGNVLRSANRTAFLRVVCQEINSSLTRELLRAEVVREWVLFKHIGYLVLARFQRSWILKIAICFR